VGVSRYFRRPVYGALDDYRSFSKKILIERLIAAAECSGPAFLGLWGWLRRDPDVKEVAEWLWGWQRPSPSAGKRMSGSASG